MTDEPTVKDASSKADGALSADWEERVVVARKERLRILALRGAVTQVRRPKPWEADQTEIRQKQKLILKTEQKSTQAAVSPVHRDLCGRLVQSGFDPVQAEMKPSAKCAGADVLGKRSLTTVISPQEPILNVADQEPAPTRILYSSTLLGLGIAFGATLGFAGSAYLDQIRGRVSAIPAASTDAPALYAGEAIVKQPDIPLAMPSDADGLAALSAARPSTLPVARATPSLALPKAPIAPARSSSAGRERQTPAPAQLRAPAITGNSIAQPTSLQPSPLLKGLTKLEFTSARLETSPTSLVTTRSNDTSPNIIVGETAHPFHVDLVDAIATAPTPDPSPTFLAPADGIRLAERPDRLADDNNDPPFICSGCISAGPDASAMRLSLHASGSLSDVQLSDAVGTLQQAGFTTVVPKKEQLNVLHNQVRFYHSQDARAAQAIAQLTDADALDLSSFRPAPDEGVIEIWLADTQPNPFPPD